MATNYNASKSRRKPKIRKNEVLSRHTNPLLFKQVKMRSYHKFFRVLTIVVAIITSNVATEGENNPTTLTEFHRTSAACMKNEPSCWEVSGVKGLIKGSTLHLRRLENINLYSTCYEVICVGKQCPPPSSSEAVIQFCFPSIIVTGSLRCGTRAIQNLIARFPNANIALETDSCPYLKHRPHWQYFNQLRKVSSIQYDSIIFDRCMDTKANMMMREFLRQPKTKYIVSFLTENIHSKF